MKKYSEYKNEITPSELYDGLIGHGLFAEKIPNFLTSEAFLSYTKNMAHPLNDKPKDYVRYASMRNINIPRPLAIPEPFAYASLINSLSENWSELQDHFTKKTINDKYKISRIHLRKLSGKSELFQMNYKNFSKDGEPEQDIVIKSKFIACADISNCFPSIYSHSIVWALVEKSYAKANKAPINWFNQLDFYIRNVKFGETNGVLIGPHASNLLAEIVLVAVDHRLSSGGFKYVRNIDDYTCYVESVEEADRFFLCLSEELKKYELALNSKKSKIISLPQASVKNWVTKLNHFNFTNTYWVGEKEGVRIKELKGFLDFAVELMLEEDSDGSILNYAIKILSNKYLGANAKGYYIKQIHHLVLLYPYLINLLEENVFEAHDIDNHTIKNIATDIYFYGVNRKFYEACSYAVYWSIKYGFDIEIDSLKEDSIQSNDCIFMLISYLSDKKHKKKIYLTEYKDLAKTLKNDDFDRYWLFVYEVLPWNEQPGHYKGMKKNGLTFVKPHFR